MASGNPNSEQFDATTGVVFFDAMCGVKELTNSECHSQLHNFDKLTYRIHPTLQPVYADMKAEMPTLGSRLYHESFAKFSTPDTVS